MARFAEVIILPEVLLIILFFYYIAMNVLLFFMMLVDKKRAQIQNCRNRIPERTLLSISLLGGGIGGFIAMHLFRHKSRKNIFVIVYLISILVHSIILFLFASWIYII